MLTRVRNYVNRVNTRIVEKLAVLGVKPLHLTISSPILAALAFTTAYLWSSHILFLLLTILSGLLDVLDGALARFLNKASKRGAFLDSTLDRVSDSLIIYSLIYFGFSFTGVVYVLVVSLLISYVRARSESLGLSMEGVGIIERAERLIFIAAVIALQLLDETASHILFYLFAALSTITLIQRIVYVLMNIEKRR